MTSFRAYSEGLTRGWERLSLVQKFVLAASVVLSLVAVMLATFVSIQIEAVAASNAAASVALHINSHYESRLDPRQVTSLTDELYLREIGNSFKVADLEQTIVSVRILNFDGNVLSNVGPEFNVSVSPTDVLLQKALRGDIAHEFVGAPGIGASDMAKASGSLLRVLAPIRAPGSDRVLGVTEAFLDAASLNPGLRQSKLEAWLIVGALQLFQFALLCIVVAQGNKALEAHRAVLVDARRTSAEANERFLRRVGAELHDGAAQLIALALLRLDSLYTAGSKEANLEELERIRDVLNDSLQEIRHVCAGLAPPQLEYVSPSKAVELAIRQHEQRTGTSVASSVDELPTALSPVVKACIYRVVQEGLNNAFRHAGGAGQAVHVMNTGEEVAIEVRDAGPGFCPSEDVKNTGLGLPGLKDRIESLGGRFTVDSRRGRGTCLRASFQMVSLGGQNG